MPPHRVNALNVRHGDATISCKRLKWRGIRLQPRPAPRHGHAAGAQTVEPCRICMDLGIVSDKPTTDPSCACRNGGAHRGGWENLHRAISGISA